MFVVPALIPRIHTATPLFTVTSEQGTSLSSAAIQFAAAFY
jgi:hypothetical protein